VCQPLKQTVWKHPKPPQRKPPVRRLCSQYTLAFKLCLFNACLNGLLAQLYVAFNRALQNTPPNYSSLLMTSPLQKFLNDCNRTRYVGSSRYQNLSTLLNLVVFSFPNEQLYCKYVDANLRSSGVICQRTSQWRNTVQVFSNWSRLSRLSTWISLGYNTKNENHIDCILSFNKNIFPHILFFANAISMQVTKVQIPVGWPAFEKFSHQNKICFLPSSESWLHHTPWACSGGCLVGWGILMTSIGRPAFSGKMPWLPAT
jgi:hypothetical protein